MDIAFCNPPPLHHDEPLRSAFLHRLSYAHLYFQHVILVPTGLQDRLIRLDPVNRKTLQMFGNIPVDDFAINQ